jgi:hypothetical protein
MKRAAAFWSLLRGASLALLVGELLAPAPAAASCGDYVTFGHSNPSGHSPPPAPQTNSAQTLPPFGEVPDAPLPPARSPCPAPSCSGDPVPPAPATATGQEDGRERWDCLLAPPSGGAAAAFAVSLEDRPLKPSRSPCSIFHPPRPC